jgi:catechol 2,3-dioxygenase-like lactoylglutathione lyase family enzyme
MPIALIEFPADDVDRARRFWSGLLGVEIEPRSAGQGEGWRSSETWAICKDSEGSPFALARAGAT